MSIPPITEDRAQAVVTGRIAAEIPAPQSEAELIAVARRDPAGFGPLYDAYITPLFQYLYTRVGTVRDAEGLAGQVFWNALERLPEFSPREDFAGWLFGIAHNLMDDFFRKPFRRVPLEFPDCVPLAVGPDPVEDGVAQVRPFEIERMRQLVNKLPEDDRELLRLHYVAGLTERSIAAALGMSEESVRRALQRLLARLDVQIEATRG